jgi:hypothetical protein
VALACVGRGAVEVTQAYTSNTSRA